MKRPFPTSRLALFVAAGFAAACATSAAVEARPETIAALVQDATNSNATNSNDTASNDTASKDTDSIELGRRALEDDRLGDARAAFERAAAAEPRGEAQRLWLPRLEIAEGNQDEVLASISRLAREQKAEPDVRYLLGMALAAKCEADLAAGGSSSLQFMLEDAQRTLQAACELDGARYRDAHLALCSVALALGDTSAAVEAGRRAVDASPSSARAELALGKALLGRVVAAFDKNPSDIQTIGERAAETEEHLMRAVELIGDAPTRPELEQLAAEAWNQVAVTRAYDANPDGAADAYTEVLALDPETVNLGRVLQTVGAERFRALLPEASARFVRRHGKADARDAALQWWYGWALYDADDPRRFDDAEAALRTALAKNPEYLSAHHYLALLNYARQDYDAALAELEAYWTADLAGLAATVASDSSALNKLLGLLDHFAQANRREPAAFVAEVLANAYPTHDPYWNNLGLFLRDLGEELSRSAAPSDEAALARVQSLYERSFDAYSRALDLSPDSPAYLNDTAVLLHYYLERDYERAIAMYERAAELAEAQLASGELPKNEIEIVQIALRDARNNKRLLEKKMGA